MTQFFKDKNYEFPCIIIEQGRPIISDGNTGAPLKLTEQIIDELAQKTGILTGKWLIHIGKKRVDDFWNKIQDLIEENSIFHNAKVSTIAHPWKKEDTHVICVYTKNYLDKNKVIEARNKLRNIGKNEKIRYKPDIYTYLGIYSDTKEKFGLKKATRYYF
ncbi:MAG: DUF1917 domain-containing protein [Candidatus Lokiarchaeota archaeon]|nr:DUF1917 domain-containing protein [Candidatus Lokiarchaeota archaeon]